MPWSRVLTAKHQHLAFGAAAAALAAVILFAPLEFGRHHDDEGRNIELGLWSLRFLTATLVMGSLARLLKRPGLSQWGQPLGLAAFGFALVHTLQYIAYAGLWPDRMERLLRRPYLQIGVVALMLMAPLAATSTAAIVRRIGFRRWKRLHRLVYPIAALSIAHHLMAYGGVVEGGVHVILFCGLMGERIWSWRARAARPAVA